MDFTYQPVERYRAIMALLFSTVFWKAIFRGIVDTIGSVIKGNLCFLVGKNSINPLLDNKF